MIAIIIVNTIVFSQQGFIRGTVLSEISEPLIGANVAIEETSTGAMTDADGNFSIDGLDPGSYKVSITYIGYKKISRTYVITAGEDTGDENYLDKLGIAEDATDDDIAYGETHSGLRFILEPDAVALRQVDVTGHELEKSLSDIAKQTIFGPSKIRESYMTVGSSVDAVSIKDIRMSPSLNFYEGLDDIKEVESKQLSAIYTSLNVRGKGATDPRSYSQLVDGMQAINITYGNNFGNIVGLSEIDVANIELVHGAASVLYGPYSTSGLVLISSKTPWFYQGLSYQLKSGLNHKTGIETTPFAHTSIRYAKAYDKFAFKFVYSDKRATEWAEPGDSSFIQPSIGSEKSTFDMVYLLGDDTPVNQVEPGVYADTLGPIVRTGYWDRDIMPSDVYNTKINSSLRYKVSDDIEVAYDLKGGWGSFTNINISKNWVNHSGGFNHGLSLTGRRWSARAYTYSETRNPFVNTNEIDSWDVRGIALQLQNYAKPDSVWYLDYLAAYAGEISGITFGSHTSAREFADSDNSTMDGEYKARLEPGSSEFDAAYDSFIQDDPGATTSLSDNKLTNFEFIYDLTDFVKFGGVQVGGSFRQYDIGHYGGSMSNTPEINEEHGELRPWEYALFVQSTKWLFDKKLKLQGALRFDASISYGKNVSPSFSSVLKTLDDQYLRFSYQQASLNPSFVWSYLSSAQPGFMAVGGTKDNLERLGLERLHNNAVVIDWVSGDTTHIEVAYPTPEKLSAYEFGYKALVADNLFFDINYYFNHSTNLRDDSNIVFDPEQVTWVDIPGVYTGWSPGMAYYVYSHSEDLENKLHGLSFSAAYNLDNGMIISGNYNFIDETETTQSTTLDNTGYVGTSRPKNRYKFSLNHPRAINNNIGYAMTARYSEKYWYDNYVWFGTAEIGGNLNVDAQVSYILSDYNMLVKLGVNNLLGQYYNTAVQTAKIGSTFYLSLVYDGLIK